MTTSGKEDLTTRLLLACGTIGPLLFIVVLLTLGATRPGYSAWHHFGSLLSLSEWGWMQIANFLVCGLLLICFTVGVWRVLWPGKRVVLQKISRSSTVREKSKRGPTMTEQNPFKWCHFQSDIILLCVRWYLRYSLSYRDLEEMMLERGLHVDHTTIYRWVQKYAPELEKRCRPHLKACNGSWKVDETYIKIKTVWFYLYRAVDSAGNTLEFLLSPTRDAEAATRFFCKALHVTPSSTPQACLVQEQVAQPTVSAHLNSTKPAPRVINVDKNAAYPKAIADLKAAGILPASVELRQVKYLNNLIEQDHRFIKRLTKPGMGFFSFETAWRTLQGFEVMNMIRKGQLQGVAKGDVRSQVVLIATLFGVAV